MSWIWLIVVALTYSAAAGPVRLSFLDGSACLDDTARILSESGCKQPGISAFQRIVRSNYSEEFKLNKSKFPPATDGFYSFSNMDDLVKCLPHRLSQSTHTWSFNCFDTVILLAHGNLVVHLHPDEKFGPFMVSIMTTNGEEVIISAATARDAFSRMVPQWYRETTATILPADIHEARIALMAELFRWHLLPQSTTQASLAGEVWSALRSDWRRAGLKFPQGFQVVLYHKADLQAHTLCSHHAGLLFPSDKGFTYLEKAGGAGPFVRLDFPRKSDLLPWLSSVFSERENRHANLFVTFNDTEILELPPVSKVPNSPAK